MFHMKTFWKYWSLKSISWIKCILNLLNVEQVSSSDQGRLSSELRRQTLIRFEVHGRPKIETSSHRKIRSNLYSSPRKKWWISIQNHWILGQISGSQVWDTWKKKLVELPSFPQVLSTLRARILGRCDPYGLGHLSTSVPDWMVHGFVDVFFPGKNGDA